MEAALEAALVFVAGRLMLVIVRVKLVVRVDMLFLQWRRRCPRCLHPRRQEGTRHPVSRAVHGSQRGQVVRAAEVSIQSVLSGRQVSGGARVGGGGEQLHWGAVMGGTGASVQACEHVLAQCRRMAIFAIVEVLRRGGALEVLHGQTVAQDILLQVRAGPKLPTHLLLFG